VGDLGRLFRVVARDDRIGGLAPGALLRRCLSLRHTILICAMEVRRDPLLVDPSTLPVEPGQELGFQVVDCPIDFCSDAQPAA
jgi:hypothetical protein